MLDRAGVDALYAPRRTVLDPVIADGAREAGAEVRFGVTVSDLLRDGTDVTGVIGRNDAGTFRARADLVVGADGIRSTVARLVDAPTTRAGSSDNAVMYGYWEGVEAAGYEWFYRPGYATGLITTNDEHTLIFTAIPPEQFHTAATGDLEGAFRTALAEHAPELLQRVDAGARVERLRGFKGATGFMRRPWGSGWALVGDAGYYKDPITVHGITDALRDAELLRPRHPEWRRRNSSRRVRVRARPHLPRALRCHRQDRVEGLDDARGEDAAPRDEQLDAR